MMQRLIIVSAMFVLALVSPMIAPYDPYQVNADTANQLPNLMHLLGSDALGRDVLSRLMHGAPITLGRALAATLLVCAVGGIIGAASGAFGRWLDALVSMWVNAWLAFPSFVLALVIVTLIGQGEIGIVLAIAAAQVAVYTQYARAVARAIRHEPYIESARALGASRLWVFWRHIVPNALPQLIGFGGVIFAYAILTGAALGFVGIAGQIGLPEWGMMLAEGRQNLRAAPWVSLSAGAAITCTVLLVNGITSLPHRPRK